MLFWVSLSYFSVAMLYIPEELVYKFPGNSPISTFSVTIQGLGLQTYTTESCFYRFQGSNGRPQWALFPTKPSPLPIKCIFTMCFCICFFCFHFSNSLIIGDSLELLILSPPLQYWNYRHVPWWPAICFLNSLIHPKSICSYSVFWLL